MTHENADGLNQGNDYHYMAMALRLARKGLNSTHPNPRVGCVLVKDGDIVGSGWHEKAGLAHAEINALNQAGDKAQGATAYVTLEPCCHQGRTGPCSQALIKAQVARVVVAMLDPNPLVAGKGMQQLADAGINTQHGILQQQAEALNPGFIKRMQQGRPWVCCKLAVSLAGHTAMADGESQWTTGKQPRLDVHHWRARSSAILTGVGTVLSDDPSLNVRWPDFADEFQPLRVILDSRLQTPKSAKCLTLPGRTLIFTQNTDEQKIKQLQQAGAEIVPMQSDTEDTGIDLHRVMQYLADAQINEVWVEAGATLNGALLQAELMDQCFIYMAPHFMGSHTRPMLETTGLNAMKDRIDLEITQVRAVGNDWRFTVIPKATQNEQSKTIKPES